MFDFFFKKKEGALTLPFKTDIHAHIIPGVDDGSPDLETSLHLIENMHRWGIEKIIATPHRTDVTFENTPAIIEPKYNDLKDHLKSKQIPVDLSYSFEYRMDEGFINLKDQNALRPLKGNYLLVENSFVQPLWNLEELIFELKLKGFTPIFAHPERYAYYHNHKDVYEQLHRTDLLFQVNVLSFAGYYGKKVQEVSFWMLEKGFVDFMGTDIHQIRHIESIDNFLKSKTYKKILPKLSLRNDLI